MIKTLTANQFAYGAMLLGMLLIGIVVGAWIGGYGNVREWFGAASGWAATLAAATAIIYMHQANKIQRDAIVGPKVEKLCGELTLAHLVAEDLVVCAQQFRALAKPDDSVEMAPPQGELWKIVPSEKNILEPMNYDVYREIAKAWVAALAICETPRFNSYEEQEQVAQQHLTPADQLALMDVYAALMNACGNLHTNVIIPRTQTHAELGNELS
ncbi:hypothetical protein [Roseibium sp. SCP14]|uniref:hypothetical protein n=1 Tax=Roseibium sp. SCP14 TaxID=3141375 RepID=UPI0033388CAC